MEIKFTILKGPVIRTGLEDGKKGRGIFPYLLMFSLEIFYINADHTLKQLMDH